MFKIAPTSVHTNQMPLITEILSDTSKKYLHKLSYISTIKTEQCIISKLSKRLYS